MLDVINQDWLCNYSVGRHSSKAASENLDALWRCEWRAVLSSAIVSDIFSKKFADTSIDANAVVLPIAIAALQAFAQENFIGPLLEPSDTFNQLPWQMAVQELGAQQFREYLIIDGEEINCNVKHPELLALAKFLFMHIEEQCKRDVDVSMIETFVRLQWLLRFNGVYQSVIDENCATLFENIGTISRELYRLLRLLPHELNKESTTICLLEIVQWHLHYRQINTAKEYLDHVQNDLDVNVAVEGRLGKRTKHQIQPKPLLTLCVTPKAGSVNGAEQESRELEHLVKLPTLLQLDDEVLLERPVFENDADNAIFTTKRDVQALVLAIFNYIRKSQPHDNLSKEEVQPYVSMLLDQEHGPWSIRISALLINIAIEATQKRTVERSLKQCEQIMKTLKSNESGVSVFHRFMYFWSSYPKAHWTIKSQLADLMMSLGFVKTALDLYLDISHWRAIVACYNVLELKHKAAEVLQKELQTKESVELYCLLGDTLDDKSWYFKAIEFANGRSGMAERDLGYYYFGKKQYIEAIPHLERSIEFNSLNENVWARLGYAALTIERWELAAKAYRHYTNIEPNGFESWNNLAKAYLNLGKKDRAHKILNEALRCNYDNWKVWENFMLVSIDTGHFEDVLNAHHRLLEIKTRYLDAEVLTLTVNSIEQNLLDAHGNPSSRLRPKALKILAELCVKYPNEGIVFELSAKLLNTEPLQRAQKLQKGYKAFTQTQNNWTKTPENTKKVCQICHDLCAASLEAYATVGDSNKASVLSQLSSARLTTQGCVRAIKSSEWEEHCIEQIPVLEAFVETIKDTLLANA